MQCEMLLALTYSLNYMKNFMKTPIFLSSRNREAPVSIVMLRLSSPSRTSICITFPHLDAVRLLLASLLSCRACSFLQVLSSGLIDKLTRPRRTRVTNFFMSQELLVVLQQTHPLNVSRSNPLSNSSRQGFPPANSLQ